MHLCPLSHDEQIIKPPEIEVAFLGGFAVVAHFQRFVVADDGDNVDGFEFLAEQSEEFEAERMEDAAGFVVFVAVADVEGHVFAGF